MTQSTYRTVAGPMRLVRALAFAAVLVLLAACSAGGTKKDSTAEVEQRAIERWNFLIAHEAEKAWDYLTPGYRATITREDYAAAMNHRPVQWTSVNYVDRHCEADRCSVTLNVRYSLKMAGVGSPVESASPQTETWIRTRGTWYFLPSD